MEPEYQRCGSNFWTNSSKYEWQYRAQIRRLTSPIYTTTHWKITRNIEIELFVFPWRCPLLSSVKLCLTRGEIEWSTTHVPWDNYIVCSIQGNRHFSWGHTSTEVSGCISLYDTTLFHDNGILPCFVQRTMFAPVAICEHSCSHRGAKSGIVSTSWHAYETSISKPHILLDRSRLRDIAIMDQKIGIRTHSKAFAINQSDEEVAMPPSVQRYRWRTKSIFDRCDVYWNLHMKAIRFTSEACLEKVQDT